MRTQIHYTKSAPLFEQVYESLGRQIMSGEMASGARLPPSRELARELGVSRSTIVAAYDQLAAEGYIRARQGSGYYVCDIEPVRPPDAHGQVLPAFRPEPAQSRPLHPRPFTPGVPDMRLFPHAKWARHLSRTAKQSAEAMLAEEDGFGHPRLRAAIAGHLASWRGIPADPERILITAGAGDALDLSLRVLASTGDGIGLERPGYRPMLNLAQLYNLRPEWLDVEEEGAALPGEEAGVKTIILTPSHQFPLGGAMSTGRRLAFLQYAARNDSVVIEDDFDSEFRFAGRPIPAMASLDDGRRVVYVGSFSKIFSSGLKIGFMVLPEHLVGDFNTALRKYGSRASVAPQLPLATFIEEGEFHRHIRRMRRIYGERREAFVGMLHRELGNAARFSDNPAGMQIALELADGVDDVRLSKAALAAGVACSPLSTYYDGPRRKKGLLTGFSAFSPEEMEEPLKRLAALIRDAVTALRE
ncbi:MAG: GntR family transcriptional regulator [Rhizobiaceae bacterium MnEN-MB40S]|nr:MAG: GntR family transcriptional regulator [Rhizobiaceae bacterium MnEN-MB40S]